MIKLITLKPAHIFIGDVEDISPSLIKIKYPAQVVVMPSETMGSELNFIPFNQFSEEFKTGIYIETSNILCVTTPVNELYNAYNQAFGSGLQVVSSLHGV